MANRVFPGGPLGVFDMNALATHWDATGSVIEDTDLIPAIDPERVMRLNTVAVGDALYNAHETDSTGMWAWVLVVANGAQHAYHATSKEAANGSGGIGTRIKGIKCVSQWMGEVGRSHLVRRSRSPDKPESVTAPPDVRMEPDVRATDFLVGMYDKYASSVAVFYCTPQDGSVTTSEVLQDLEALHGKQERLVRKVPVLR